MPSPEELRRFLSTDGWEEYTRKEHNTDKRAGVPAPPAQKDVPEGAEVIDLIPHGEIKLGAVPFSELLGKRQTRRRYSGEALTFEEISFLLYAAQGLRKIATKEDGTVRNYRTVPSGGARHPLETYLAVNRVENLKPGLYRYLPLDHKLVVERVETGLPERIADACLEQKFIGEAAAVFVWTTIPYRAEWRYTIVAHKMIAQDAGHACQNLYLAAESIGAGTCAVGAYTQRRMDELIGVDGEDEFVIYIAPVGHQA